MQTESRLKMKIPTSIVIIFFTVVLGGPFVFLTAMLCQDGMCLFNVFGFVLLIEVIVGGSIFFQRRKK